MVGAGVNVGDLRGHAAREGVLQGQIRSEGGWSFVVKLQALQAQGLRIDGKRGQPDTRHAGTEGRRAARTCGSASCPGCSGTDRIDAGGSKVLFLVVEVENEGIVLADVRPVSLVVKRVVEDAEAGARHKLVGG